MILWSLVLSEYQRVLNGQTNTLLSIDKLSCALAQLSATKNYGYGCSSRISKTIMSSCGLG